jgi:hypothetical protein
VAWGDFFWKSQQGSPHEFDSPNDHTMREDNGLVAGRFCASMRCVRPKWADETLPLALESAITFSASFGFVNAICERMRL